jgi:hypothetical protein
MEIWRPAVKAAEAAGRPKASKAVKATEISWDTEGRDGEDGGQVNGGLL